MVPCHNALKNIHLFHHYNGNPIKTLKNLDHPIQWISYDKTTAIYEKHVQDELKTDLVNIHLIRFNHFLLGIYFIVKNHSDTFDYSEIKTSSSCFHPSLYTIRE